jgi:hypothetical protein
MWLWFSSLEHAMHLSEAVSCTEQSPRETSPVSCPLWKQKIRYVVHRGPPVVSVLSLTNPADIVMPYTLDQS